MLLHIYILITYKNRITSIYTYINTELHYNSFP